MSSERVVGPEPEPIAALGQRERRERVADLAQRVHRIGQVGRVGVALLQAELEPEAVLRVELGRDAGAVAGEAEHLVVDERVAEELRALVVGQRVRVEVVGQIEPSRRQRQPLAEELGAQPHLAKVQLVLANEARRVAVEQRQARNLRVRRRAAQRDDVGEEDGVLRDAGREEQVGRRQRVRVVVRRTSRSPFVRLANCVVMAASTPIRTLCSSASASASSIFSLMVWRRYTRSRR